MGIRFADWRGSANPSPIAMALAEKAGVQQAPQELNKSQVMLHKLVWKLILHM